MASLYLLIPVSLIFCALAIWIFFWAVNNGQYDDLEGEANRILFEEDDDLPAEESPDSKSSENSHGEPKEPK
ncbi:MAG: cbb3-type cytochrome oxidase assembly protein CcoS [Gammaproteobacteria bacterium]|nr:MAG: cbb3-type cytochrome oxidase assembly protein CcoS [Gammaproteobacteria bacterium]